MKEIWIGLALAAFFSLALALTRDWWLPPESREAWHQSWLESPPSDSHRRARIQAEHDRLLAKMEKEYRERIRREKALNDEYRSERERLRKETESP